jgi:two-component system phosphate regulon sensor histidine kinase PhoR
MKSLLDRLSRIPRTRKPWQELLLPGLLALVIAATASTSPLSFLEAPLYDLRLWLSGKRSVDPGIVIITLDDQTLNQLNETSPLTVGSHLKAIHALDAHGVRAIGYAIDFTRVQRIDALSFETDAAKELYRSMVRLNAKGVPLVLGIPYDLTGEVMAPYPLSQLPQAMAVVHRDGTVFGKDKVTRRALLSLYKKPAFELALANRIIPEQSFSEPPGSYAAADTEARYFMLGLHQSDGKVYEAEYESFSYPRYSFVDLVEGKIPQGTLRDKIVLVGVFHRDNPNDYTLVSAPGGGTQVPKILVQANILDSILNGHGIREVPHALVVLLSLLLSIIVILASSRIRPSRLVLLTLALIAGTFTGSMILLQPLAGIGSIWLPLGAPYLAMAMSFYLMIPVRLYMENRKRFELEKQNRALLEVEELKTNFLQLVTHDLKTPVAKIQGLTEQLKRSLGNRLESRDIETMNQLFSANDELNHFINSLLELTQLDNQGIRVNLQSRDLNQLLEQVVLKHRFGAQAKQIEVKLDFEPLFPIRMDATLISKVLSNLMDNAIKYSPERTTVTLTTRESGDHVEITLEDQGIGIPESEIGNLFSRFYRINNDTTRSVKGTGLGLYLSKYFIEAHRGELSVESRPGQGTKFLIRLPLELTQTEVVRPGLPLTGMQTLKNKEKSHA